MAAIHSHLEVRAIGTVLRSLHVTSGRVIRFDAGREWPASDDWFDGWDKTLAGDFAGAESEDRPVVLWDPVNATELTETLGPLLEGPSPLILVANLGFPFGERGARRYPAGDARSEIGLHPFSGEPLAQGIYAELDWEQTAEAGLSVGLANMLADHDVAGAPEGRLSDHRKVTRCAWDLSATLGCSVIVTRSWLRDVGLYRTTFGAVEAAVHKAMLAELWPMTRRLALRNQGLEDRTDRLGALAERMQNLRDRTRLAESLLAERDQWAASAPVGVTAARASAAKPQLSIVHISYDMAREAPRSIRSALPPYQSGIAAGAVEVIAVDNGSPAPLALGDDEMVRLHRMDPATTTLAAAINTGVDLATADRVAIMIDGAHLLSPGVVSWTLRSFDLLADPVIATPRYFLGPSQQVDAHLHGYDTEAEDRLLEERGWPDNGYALFDASVLIGDTSQTWASALFETNYLAMTKAAFAEIGGADTRFGDPAGGFLNMDLFSRAVERMHGEYVLLAGEGTFHQLHGGTTTNTSRKNRSAKVERYREEFERLHGRAYVPTPRRPLVVGHLHAGVIESRSFSESFQHETNLQRADLLADHLKRAASGDAT